jgi:hypothetical protein
VKTFHFASRPAAALVGLLAIGACTDAPVDSGLPPSITWAEHVSPILYRSCLGCHSGQSVQKMEGIGHFPLERFSDAESVAIYLQQVVLSKRMPPWPGGATCEGRPSFLDDLSLSKEERLLILEWTEGDLASGSLSENPPLPPEWDLPGQTHTLFPPRPIQPDTEVDGYPCLLLDLEITQDHWMTGLQGLPDNRSVLAGMTAWIVAPDRLTEAQGIAEKPACFGLDPLPDLPLLGVWSPGSAPFETPADSGILLPAGSQILLRLHHHVWQGEDVQADQSGIGLRLTANPPGQTARLIAVGNADSAPHLQPQGGESSASFKIPANTQHTEEMLFPPSESEIGSTIWAVGGWMHWAGSEMSISLVGEATDCLVALEDWRPDWMRLYRYNSEEELPIWNAETKLRLLCTYENNERNDGLMDMLDQHGINEVKDRTLGQDPQDEACLAIVGLLQPSP